MADCVPRTQKKVSGTIDIPVNPAEKGGEVTRGAVRNPSVRNVGHAVDIAQRTR